MSVYAHVVDEDITVILFTDVHPGRPVELMHGVLTFYLGSTSTGK